MDIRLRLLLMAGLILTSAESHGKVLTEAQIYKRCYTQFTQSVVPLNDPRLLQIRSKTKTGVQACSELLSEAKFDAAGRLVSITPLSKKIIRTFNGIHRTWFHSTKFEDLPDYGEMSRGTPEVFDPTEPSLFLTKYLFTPNAQYKNMLRGNQGVRAIRQADNTAPTALNSVSFKVPNIGRYMYGINSTLNYNKMGFMPPDTGWYYLINRPPDAPDLTQYVTLPVQNAGEVIGVESNTLSMTVPNFTTGVSGSGVFVNARIEYGENIEYSFDIYKNRGGGLLGSPTYFMLNNGHPKGTVFDGAFKVPRAWSKYTMESLLCVNLPALREGDILQYQVPTATTTFRNSRSCLKCHATIDQFAYTARNWFVAEGHTALSGIVHAADAKYTMLVSQFKPNLPAVAGWPSERVPNFNRQESKGTLYFRSSDGTLINSSVANVEELGQGLSETNDYYQCAAKRYFEYFTGISVSLHDVANPDNEALNRIQSTTDLADRKFIEDLGKRLRTTGSLYQLIQDIIQSNYYKYSNFRSEGT